MTNETLALRILVALYRSASRGGIPTESSLCAETGIAIEPLLQLLAQLDRAGYVDAAQVRLTLPGLALAVAATPKTKIKAKSKPMAHAA